MFIQTEKTSDADSLKFLPGEQILESGEASFASPGAASRAPLAQRLFEVDGVATVRLDTDSITVGKDGALQWDQVKASVLAAIMDHFSSGAPAVLPGEDGGDADQESPAETASGDIAAKIEDLINTRIRPAAEQDGGDVVFHEFKNGTVYIEMIGSAGALRMGIENMLRYYVPEVEAVRDYRDAIPKPGLDTPTGLAVKKILDERINPSVASHGGHIALVDVKEDTVFIRLEGGCQGCGMANVTLKQGIEVEIMKGVPEITTVLDTTDHAGGSNPYYAPGK